MPTIIDQDDELICDAGAPWHDGDNRLVGLEIEYKDGANALEIHKFLQKWRAGNHEDASCGYEIVTAPLAGRYIGECLVDFAVMAKRADMRTDDTCSVHVHVDARDLTWSDMYRLIRVYAHLEPLLYALGGQHRLANHYCKPSAKSYTEALAGADRKSAIIGVAYDLGRYDKDFIDGYVIRYCPGKKHQGRYKGMNICPWLAGRRTRTVASDTTVEFRIHRDSLNPYRLIGWSHLLASIVTWCSAHTDAQLTRVMRRSALRTLVAMCPESYKWIKGRLTAWRRATKPTGRRVVVRNGEWVAKTEDI